MTHNADNQEYFYFSRWLMPVEENPIQDAYMTVVNGVISSVGKITDLPEEKRPSQVDIDVISPGLINVHTHLEQSVGRVIARLPEQSFADWLIGVLKTMGDYQSKDERRQLCQSGIEEVLASGTTCVSDIGRDTVSYEALSQSGLRGISALEFFHPDPHHLNRERLDTLIEQYQQLQQDDCNVTVALSPHSPYNVSPLAWQYVSSQLPEALVHTHLAEPIEEVPYLQGSPSSLSQVHQFVLKQTYQYPFSNASPVAFMEEYGLLNNQLVATHLLQLNDTDLLLLQKNQVKVAHCPRSNINLHGKTLDWPQWYNKKIALGLGTDGHLSTPDLDIRAEARMAIQCHGWTEAETLAVLTRGGASVLGLTDKIGTITTGKQADFVCWQVPASLQNLAPEAQLLHQETLVEASYVAGQVVYPARKPVTQ